MAAKPSYLGLLNAIAVGEARGFKLFNAWFKACNDPVLSPVLKQVALREREHAATFSKRLNELGFDVRARPSEKFDKRLRQAGKSKSDLKKFKKLLKFHKPEKPKDPLAGIFDDPSIDIETATLVGRFIAEERDSNCLLREQYQRLCRMKKEKKDQERKRAINKTAMQAEKLASGDAQNTASVEEPQEGDTADIEMLCKRLERLTETLEVIKSLKS